MQNNYFLNIPVRSSAILTNSPVTHNIPEEDGTKKDVSGANEISWMFYYTKGSLTSLTIKVEKSTDGSHWVPETVSNFNNSPITLDQTGTFTTTHDGNFVLSYPLSARFARVTVTGVDTLTSSLLAIDAYIHYV